MPTAPAGARDGAKRVRVGQRGSVHPRLKIGNLLRKSFGGFLCIGVERERGQAVAPGRAPDAEVDATRRDGFQHAELLGDLQRRVVRQHHARAADANALRGRRDRRHQDFRRGADDAAAVVVLGDPVAAIAEHVAEAGERERFADGLVFRRAFGSR